MNIQPKVLVADDEAGGRIALESMLYGEGYELHFAEDGLQAVAKANEIRPDIILLDVMMPGLNGFEVCRNIRSTPGLANTPIVLVTSLDDQEARMAGIKAGADDFVSKPFDKQELRLHIRNLTRLNHYIRQDMYNLIELKFYEAFVGEQNNQGDPAQTHLHAIANIRDYVEAEDALLILFDADNPGMAFKKRLGPGPSWNPETLFIAAESPLCNPMPSTLKLYDVDGSPWNEKDPILQETFIGPVRRFILAPLLVNHGTLGALLITNPCFSLTADERRTRFLQLMIQGVANTIFMMEHTRQLTISKAALEASRWEIINSRNMLRTFFDNIPSCAYVIDKNYNIQIINSQRSQRVSKDPSSLVGRKCHEALFESSTPCPQCRVIDAFNGAASVRERREWLPKENFIQWEISTVPIFEAGNYVNQVIVFDEDITEKWMLEASLAESEKMASIGQLAANVAHEINNPLAAVIANVQLLQRSLRNADEDTREALDLIEMAGARAAKIVSNLLKSARKEKRDEFDEVSLNDTILEALSMVNFEIRNRDIKVNLTLEENMPNIAAHQNQLKGVWINLIMNALGAMEGKPGELSITTRFEENEYRIAISDNGAGIPVELHGRVFEPFFTTKETGKGTGLGLSVSQQVIKDHHGTIDFESKAGLGTKFIVILPSGLQTNDNETE